MIHNQSNRMDSTINSKQSNIKSIQDDPKNQNNKIFEGVVCAMALRAKMFHNTLRRLMRCQAM